MLSKYSKRRQIFIISLILFIVIDLLFLIIITLPTTRGFYESSGSSNVEVKIAGWNFLVNGKKEIEKVEIDLSKTLNKEYEKIIPGSSGVINLNIDTTGTDVTMKCKIEMVEEETNKPKNIKLYKDSSYQEEIEDGYEFIIKYDEDKTEKKIYWKWEYTEEDEKEWMEKEIKIKLNVIGEQIIDEEDSILYKKGTLAYEIIKNAMKASEDTERTIYSPEPLTKPAQEVSGENERTLSVTEDDYGESYYYRGNVQDNYLNFNNMCWRIVRIEGDGSIKLILEDQTKTCEDATGGENAFIGEGTYGYIHKQLESGMDFYIPDYENCTSNSTSCMKTQFDNWFNEQFTNTQDKLKIATWNLGYSEADIDEEYLKKNNVVQPKDALRILQKINAQLKSDSDDLMIQSKIATLTIDEAALAGGVWGVKNENYYLYNPTDSWQLISLFALTRRTVERNLGYMSRFYISGAKSLHQWDKGYGALTEMSPSRNFSLRPSIVLKRGIELIEGDGLKTSPYKV